MALSPATSASRSTMSVADGATTGLKIASANPTTGAQNAGLQEPRIGPEISFNPCRRLQHLQRPTPSDIRPNAPGLSRRGNGHVADGGRDDLRLRRPQA